MKDKKWLKTKILEGCNRADEYIGGYRVIDVSKAIDLVDMLEEPCKATMPVWFDEWVNSKIESGLRYDCLDLAHCMIEDYNNDKLTNEQEGCVIDNPHGILSALLYGYEVEEEKLYWVRGRYGCALLQRDGDRIMNSSPAAVWEQTANPKRYQFTEREINRFDKRFWAFSVPVEEE